MIDFVSKFSRPGNAIVERLLYSPAPPPVASTATLDKPSLLSAARHWHRLEAPMRDAFRAIGGFELSAPLRAAWPREQDGRGSAVRANVSLHAEQINTPKLRVGYSSSEVIIIFFFLKLFI